MGSIIARKRKSGETAYLARARVMRDGLKMADSQTFDSRKAAASWLAKREHELSSGINNRESHDPLLADVIAQHLAERQRPAGRTLRQVLRTISGMDIASMRCSRIGSKEIVQFAKQLSCNVKPATVQHYLSTLSGVFQIARPALGYPLDRSVINDALVVTKRLGITSKSNERQRRPTLWLDLTPEALAIIQAQPKKSDRIFPYKTDAICMAFVRACQRVGIEDLRFHDLRRQQGDCMEGWASLADCISPSG